ncbi:hypothetical protein G6F24_014618 [Rhizopus arrhizus]|nr:hypothetical protein G6F24_014618 [Rhizopus arrhizus]
MRSREARRPATRAAARNRKTVITPCRAPMAKHRIAAITATLARVRAATSTTATMNTIDRSAMPTQRSASQATTQASAVAISACTGSWLKPRTGAISPSRRERARACGVLMMVIS